jgi:hypothetical protein
MINRRAGTEMTIPKEMLKVRPDVKVVVSSGDGTVDLAGFPGALRILHKPYAPSLLYGVVREVLDGSR